MNFQILGKAFLFCAMVTGISKVQSLLLPARDFTYGLIGVALTIAVTLMFLKLDKKSFRDIEFKFDSKTIIRFFVGLIVGTITVGLLVLFVTFGSDSTIQFNKNSNLLFVVLIALPSTFLLALTEEIGFRGYPFIISKNAFGIWIATVITSILFGLYHVVFGWGLIGFCSTTIWGFVFSSLAVRSGGISIPTGFHTGINFAQLIFGLTNNSFSIWTVNKLHSERFVVTFIVAPLIFYMVTMKAISKNKNVPAASLFMISMVQGIMRVEVFAIS